MLALKTMKKAATLDRAGAGDAAQQLAVGGDALLNNTGLLTVQDGAINSDKIKAACLSLLKLNNIQVYTGST